MALGKTPAALPLPLLAALLKEAPAVVAKQNEETKEKQVESTEQFLGSHPATVATNANPHLVNEQFKRGSQKMPLFWFTISTNWSNRFLNCIDKQ